MRTTSGLDVPSGWATKPPDDKRRCPVCNRLIRSYVAASGYRLMSTHDRALGNGVVARCPGTNREAPR